MLENRKAVIFDLDGTLVDSMWMWREIDIEFLSGKGIVIPEDIQDFQDELEGMGFTETAVFFKKRFRIPDSIEDIKNTWILMAEDKYSTQVPLKPGAGELLDMLKKRNFQIGISSSNSTELIRTVLKAHEIEDYFGCITTCCQVPAGKPAPDVYLETAKGLGIAPEDCLVFEDVPMGILAGKSAGMQVCAVEDETALPKRREIRKLADYYIRSYDEILDHTYEVLS